MSEETRRLDQWLWFARLQKSRTLAAALVRAGHLRVNGQKTADPAKPLRIGDVLTVALARTTLVVAVRSLGTRRGPPAEARGLYREPGRDDGELASDPDSG